MAKKTSKKPSWDVDGAAKLASSGIAVDAAEHSGLHVVPDASKLDPSFKALKALVLPYRDVDGRDSGFYRIRYLEQESGFAAAVKKPQRYAQPPNTLNWAYLPPTLPWPQLANDRSEVLYITEGELKALAASLNGFNCLALGGVDVWQSGKKNVELLPPLNQIDWRGRPVYIVFDSDSADNEDVARAQLRLATKLLHLGAFPLITTLPPGIDGKKQGLDDYLLAGGLKESLLASAHGLSLADRLLAFNDRFAVVMDQETIVDLTTGSRSKRDSFINLTQANQRVTESFIDANGKQKKKDILIAQEWLRWTNRREVLSMVYAPGEGPLTEGQCYNLWRGWGVEPSATVSTEDIEPWLTLVEHLFESASVEERDWFYKWCATPLQRPGTKCYSSVVVWGEQTGTGKSLIGYTLGRIYGKNFAEIGNTELHANFNEWAVGKQFVLGDEITGSDKRNEADKLKALITQQMLRVNMKHLPTYEIKDCLNYYFTSNHPDAFFLDDKDRRNFILHAASERLPREFYQSYMKWLNNGGPASLFRWLLNYELGDFDPAMPAPETRARDEMIEHGKSEVGAFVANLLRNNDRELASLAELIGLKEKPELVLNTHLRLLYDPNGEKRVTANGMGRELARAGVRSVEPVETGRFGKQRFYAVRNSEKWLRAQPSAVREYIDRVYGASAIDVKRAKMK